MKKALSIFIILVLLGIGIFLFIKKIDFSEREPSIEIEPIENTRFTILKNALLSSSYFAGANVDSNEKMDVLTVNGKYDIYIKTGYYQMTIKDTKQENKYCEIVDAIEQSLGLLPGKSIETCQKTLEGSINIGGISAEIYDTYKILTVNMEEPAKLYNIENSHVEEELIPVEEINYNIQIDNYLLTSMTTSFKENNKLYSICGHMYNKNKKSTKNFSISIYDVNKKLIDTKKYKYENDTKKYIPFCVDYSLESDTVKYYSIKGLKK